jgi:prepilin-type N-terminal cleavage/methylation domain-containing protein
MNPRRCFTLIELVVVMVIMGLLAAVAIPRLGGHQGRSFQLTLDQVADLLTMYAQRDALSERPAAIWHDTERNWLVLLAMEQDAGESGDPAEWYPDPFVDPVKLPAIIPTDGVSAWADGDAVDFTRWPISTTPGRQRQALEFELRSRDGQVGVRVLAAHAVAPYDPFAERTLEPLDLDSAGRGREDW